MSNEDSENNQTNSSKVSESSKDSDSTTKAPPPCPKGFGFGIMTPTGSTTILHPFDTDSIQRAYADMLVVFARTFYPLMCRASGCNPPCICLPIPVGLPSFWITTVPTPGSIFPTVKLNASQPFRSYCV